MVPSRRTLLKTAVPVLVGGVAGCTSRLASFSGTPDGWPRRYVDEADPVRWRLEHDHSADFRPAVADDAVVVAWGNHKGYLTGAVSKAAATTGSVDWHREVSRPPYRPPMVHGDDAYLLTGTKSGHVRDEQQLRRFGPDGTELWHTEPQIGLLDLHAFGDGRAYLGEYTRNLTQDTGFPVYAASLSDGTWDWTRETLSSSAGRYADDRLLVQFSRDAVASFDPSDGTQHWRTRGHWLTDVHRRPAIANGAVYVERDEGIAVLDPRNGSTIWEAPLGDIVEGAAVYDGTVVVSTYSDLVFGLDPSDGAELWRMQVEGSLARPLLGDGTAFVRAEGAVHAFDPSTGEHRWRTDSNAFVGDYGRGMLVTVRGSRGGGEIVALDAGDGSERWRYATPDLGGVAVGKTQTYATVGDDGLVALGDS